MFRRKSSPQRAFVAEAGYEGELLTAGRSQPVGHESKAGDILKVARIACQKAASVLDSLARQPKVLNSIVVLATGSFDLRAKAQLRQRYGRQVNLLAVS